MRRGFGRKNKKLMLMIFVIAGVVALGLAILFGCLNAKRRSEKEQKNSETAETVEDPQAALEGGRIGQEVPLPDLKASAFETEEVTVGIDVSEFQGNIDWKAVADTGIDFVMVRVGYRGMSNGKIVEDACAKYNMQEAEKYGLKIGAYFFSTAVTEQEAKEEAEWVCEVISGYPITYPVAYNCEGFASADSRQNGLTVEERSGLADIFLQTIEKNGCTGMFYAAKNELVGNAQWDAEALALKYRTWVAQYTDVAWPQKEKPDYTGVYAMWQYTNRGKISGIKNAVDFNVAYFGYSRPGQAVDPGASDHVDADPEVGVKFSNVQEQVTAKDRVNLRSTMDQGGSGNIVCTLKNGDTATRTGIGVNGWSRVIYNGQTLYCVSSYLTTDLNYQKPQAPADDGFKTQFTAVSENVTAKEVTNLRTRPSVEEPSEVIAALKHGEVIVRTGVSNEGWSRVDYHGRTLYCISSYLEVVQGN